MYSIRSPTRSRSSGEGRDTPPLPRTIVPDITAIQRRERYVANVRRICALPLPDDRSYGDMPSCPCSRQYRRTVCLGRPSPASSSTNSISASNSPLALPSLYAPLTGNLGARGFVEPSHCLLNEPENQRVTTRNAWSRGSPHQVRG